MSTRRFPYDDLTPLDRLKAMSEDCHRSEFHNITVELTDIDLAIQAMQPAPETPARVTGASILAETKQRGKDAAKTPALASLEPSPLAALLEPITPTAEYDDAGDACDQFKCCRQTLSEAIALVQPSYAALQRRVQELEGSLAAVVREHNRTWDVVRAGMEPDAYRDGTFDLHDAVQHRLAAAEGRAQALQNGLIALRINANRLCDRNMGGTYEDDCRDSIKAVDALLAASSEREAT